jgi:enterobacterial common antigen flippase
VHQNNSNNTSDQTPTDPTILKQEAEIDVADQPAPPRSSYGQILKSSAIIGGSSMINILIGIARTKFMAILLGPSGVGLMGLYTSITDLTQSIVGMGLNSSGVRQIAEAVGSEDTKRIAITAQVLRRMSIFLGLLGAVFLFGFAQQISLVTFDNAQHSNDIRLISLAIFFSIVSAGQGALIQGMRRIGDLAKMGIFGTLSGAIISIIAIYYLGEDGVAIAIVLIAAMSLATSFWYRLKIKISPHPMNISEISNEQVALLKLGFAFMSSGLMMTGSAYIIRMMIVRKVGYDAAGLYQSAWALGGLYIGIILQAMGADFYPRLTAAIKDNTECNRLVNEQAHIGMLLATPGILATLTLAPLVIELFYSSKFQGAVELLRWLCLGMSMRVMSWPMGFIIVAKGIQKAFIYSELAWTIVYLGLAWICINTYQLNGAGIAFFGSYIFHVLMVYFIVRKISGFRWSSANYTTSLIFLALIMVVFSSYYILPPLLTIGLGVIATLLSSVYSIHFIVNLVSPERIPRHVARLLSLLKLPVLRKISITGNSVYRINLLIWMLIICSFLYFLVSKLNLNSNDWASARELFTGYFLRLFARL